MHLQAVGDGGQGWSNVILYIFLSPVIRKQLFFYPVIRALYFCLRKAGLDGTAKETGEREERVRVSPQQRMKDWSRDGSRKEAVLITASDYDSGSVADDSGIVGVHR